MTTSAEVKRSCSVRHFWKLTEVSHNFLEPYESSSNILPGKVSPNLPLAVIESKYDFNQNRIYSDGPERKLFYLVGWDDWKIILQSLLS